MSNFDEVQTLPLTPSQGQQQLLLLLLLLLCIVLLLLFLTACSSRAAGRQQQGEQPGSDKSPTTPTKLDSEGRRCRVQEIRLPRNPLPRQYNLTLRPSLLPGNAAGDAAAFSPQYTGSLTMRVECVGQPTDTVVFHVDSEQRISGLAVASETPGADDIGLAWTQHCVDLQHLYLRLTRSCRPAERLSISLNFSRDIDNKLNGFYLGTYTDKNGRVRKLASTHMEPVSARKAFPCFDEPDMKATFILHMVRDAEHRSLFNMPLERTVPDTGCGVDKCFRDIYQESVNMSTYLVAFALLPLDYVSLEKSVRSRRGGVKVGIWAPSHSEQHLEFAMNVTEVVLQYFEDFFDLPYPLPKLDMIAVPDFSAGAMENWGLIVYRFVTLLYDANYTQTIEKQNVAEVITHEIAHQWFGNIVTMKWWDDLWLNEAFATFTQFLGVNQYDRSWNMMDRCYVELVTNALETDSKLHSHPIIVSGVSDPNEIESLFDDISYFKGSSLIRMLEAVIGRRVLKRGLVLYLDRFAWRNAASEDLFAAFSEAFAEVNADAVANTPAQNLTRVMETWTQQTNYPLVTARVSGRRLLLSQERFLLYPNATDVWQSAESPHNYKWIIPVMYVTDKTPEPQWVWMDLEAEKEVLLDHEPQFVKINLNQTGFYRSNYESDNWNRLVRLCREGFFGSTDVAGLINDAFTLAYSGRLNISVAMLLFESLATDATDSATPWVVALQKLLEVQVLVSSDKDTSELLRQFIINVLRPALNKILAKDDEKLSHTDKLKRQALYQLAVAARDPLVCDKFYSRYRQWRRAPNANILRPDEIDFVYQLGIIRGGRSDWEFFWNRSSNGLTSSYEKSHIIKALAMSSDFDTIFDLIQQLLNDKQLRRTDAISIAAIFARRIGVQQLVWGHLTRNWDTVLQQFGYMPFIMSDIARFPAQFHTEFDFKQTQEFFDSHSLTSGKRNAQQSLESIRANVMWLRYNRREIGEFLLQRAGNASVVR